VSTVRPGVRGSELIRFGRGNRCCSSCGIQRARGNGGGDKNKVQERENINLEYGQDGAYASAMVVGLFDMGEPGSDW
jgi:hypothetical protein